MKKVILLFMFLFLISFATSFSGGGAGTLAEPYRIANCTQLQEMNASLFANYSIINEINCSATNPSVGGSIWTNDGFIPIGTLSSAFRGNLDGNGYKISEFYINSSFSDHVGLFGYTYRAEIHDIGIVNASIAGHGTTHLGGIVGLGQESTFNNTYYSGNITNGAFSSSHIGGFAGYMWDSIAIGCYSEGNVIANTMRLGGFVGYVQGNMQHIQESYSSSSVQNNAPLNYYAGGFVGTIHSGNFSNRLVA
jgi:hypothetical protein